MKIDENVMKMDFTVPIHPSKHFRNTWLRRWDWDINDLRAALMNCYKTEKVGTNKYETYTRHGGKGKKIIFVVDEGGIFIITGAEGK